jgi:hypothetical protein
MRQHWLLVYCCRMKIFILMSWLRLRNSLRDDATSVVWMATRQQPVQVSRTTVVILVLRRRMMQSQRHQRTFVERSVSSVESMGTLNRTVINKKQPAEQANMAVSDGDNKASMSSVICLRFGRDKG